MIIGIDPGNKETGFVPIHKDCRLNNAYGGPFKLDNQSILDIIKGIRMTDMTKIEAIAIESIQSYGMPVGQSVFETCYMIGRIIQVAEDMGIPYYLYSRPTYASAFLGKQWREKGRDKLIKEYLIQRFGKEHVKTLTNTDKRSAFAVAVYHMDVVKGGGV